jgi:hypothetical protein
MDGTILGQGSFIVPATVIPQVVAIPSNADWMRVWNYTQVGTAGAATPNSAGYDFFWQRGMPAGAATVRYKTVTTNAGVDDLILSGGFTLWDPSGQSAGALPLMGNPVNITTSTTNATRPVVTVSTTTGVSVGTIVRLAGTTLPSINGIDFYVGAVTSGVSFTLLTAGSALANNPGTANSLVAGNYTIVNYNALYYPRKRYITNITKATNAVVTTSVPHGMTPGQEIRIHIPVLITAGAAVGMTQIDNAQATILTVTDDLTFTINIDTSGYSTFAWPTTAQSPSSFPQMVPFGEDTATALVSTGNMVPSIGGLQIHGTQTGILADSTVNTGYLGMLLGTGAAGVVLGTAITGPAGTTAADVVYWIAGKAQYGGL